MSVAEADAEIVALRAELDRLHGVLPARVDVDAASVGRDLAKLVLALIEFLRRLLERQAVRRMEGGSLTDEEIERVGLALMALEEKVEEVAAQFGLKRADLELGLKPLGRLA